MPDLVGQRLQLIMISLQEEIGQNVDLYRQRKVPNDESVDQSALAVKCGVVFSTSLHYTITPPFDASRRIISASFY